jgi:Uma2 family endonuclease
MAVKKKKGPSAEKIAAIFDFDVEEVKKIIETETPNEQDAVLDYLYNPAGWHDRICTTCGRKFAASYRFVGTCSTRCRKEGLEAVGLSYDTSRLAEDRWQTLKIEPPGVVPPVAYAALESLCHRFADNVTSLSDGMPQ